MRWSAFSSSVNAINWNKILGVVHGVSQAIIRNTNGGTSLFDGVDCIGKFIETDPILSTLGSLDVTVDSIADVTCPVHEQV